ncbi:DUF2061 domain-containing protein [Hansschlegelia zhihuaiae]|uniref:DUF2061 domain-containing protein n=1 Tax=Hansschlegelia zhihuaiae TaxID=405005 RepID=A0A4Q0M6Z0_9HYPH|nr:DUF2061 domain-containing protein [Hansschlegelia zhihuaiae]
MPGPLPRAAHGSRSRGVSRIHRRPALTDIITTASASPARSLAKTISWRVLGSLDTLALGYLFTGSVKVAGSIASAEVVTKIVLYYLHERGWAHIAWGTRQPKPLHLHEAASSSPDSQSK